MQENPQEPEGGGWSGWFNPSVANAETNDVSNQSIEELAADGIDPEDPDTEDTPAQDDVESLLKKLGIDVETEYSSEVKDATPWNRWSTMELSRENEQWMPLRENSGTSLSPFVGKIEK